MGQRNIRITLTGTKPLLMHAPTLVDPLSEQAKEMKKFSSKRKKTEDDFQQMADIEFVASLYYLDGVGPYIPGEMVEASIKNGAKVTKQGMAVQRALFVTDNICPLAYTGPTDIDVLVKDTSFRHTAPVKVGMSRVIRTRPMFQQWALSAEAILDDSVMDLDVLTGIVTTAGTMSGIGDWRPRYGRYTAVVEEV